MKIKYRQCSRIQHVLTSFGASAFVESENHVGVHPAYSALLSSTRGYCKLSFVLVFARLLSICPTDIVLWRPGKVLKKKQRLCDAQTGVEAALRVIGCAEASEHACRLFLKVHDYSTINLQRSGYHNLS